MRQLKGFFGYFTAFLALSLSSFHIYTGMMGIFESRIQRGMHLLFILPLAFLLYPGTNKSAKDKVPWYDWILALLSALPSFYVVIFRDVLNARWENASPVTTIQLILGVIIITTLIEAVRRAASPALAILMVLAMIELIFGHLFTGILSHQKYNMERIIEISYMLQEEGIYGYITGVSAVFVALFVIFGAFIHSMGMGQYFIDLSFRIAGRSAGGPAKVAVISSGFFGTISGAATANVFATGIFTIPLMKKLGYRPQFAGAVEAAASTGGGLVPPIMGAAVFLMAQITQIPYITICAAALPAAIFYYLCIFLTVHFEAKKHGLKVLSTDSIKLVPWRKLIIGSYLLLPIVVLMIFLIKGYSPLKSSFYAILVCFFISQVNSENRIGIRKLVDTLVAGGKNIVMIGCACAGAGLIVSVITNTGIGLSFSSLVINISKGNTLIALFLVMCSAVILGMGLPTTASYVLAIAIGGPILIEMGGDLLSVHLFVFYFAILAAVTPPVAMAAYAGASIAGSQPMKTAFESSRLAMAGYIVPYLFYFNNGILLQGNFSHIIVSLLIGVIGIFFVTIALGGWMITDLGWFERMILLFFSILIPFPIILSNNQSLIFGVVILITLYFIQKYRVNKKKLNTER